jgi:Mn2+/Fe2+ NRAMP family transporter
MNIVKKLGPGLLYAAAAVGVSHLVQSTRAGAIYGSSLIGAIILANLIKMPTFAIATRYTAATGENLIDGYKRVGTFPVFIFSIITLLTMFIIQSAVTIVTAGIFSSIFEMTIHAKYVAVMMLFLCGVILNFGGYKFLDRFIKWIIIALTLTTLVSVILASLYDFPKITSHNPFDYTDPKDLFFLVALIGWMPGPLDISVWSSLWTQEKMKTAENISFKDSISDFRVGYIGTMLLALLFLAIGWLCMYRSGIEFSSNATEFATTLISLYTNTLGSWSYPIIAIAAFFTMFSTTLTCLDAFSRTLSHASFTLTLKESRVNSYKTWLMVTIIGTSLVLIFLLSSMKQMVDFATTVSFVIAPFFAIMNVFVINQKIFPSVLDRQNFIIVFQLLVQFC